MATKTVTGYKFQVEAAATNAQNSLRVHYLGNRPSGNPNGDGKPYTTNEEVSVETGTFEGNTFYYFLGDYAPVLGNPTEFDIDYDDTI